MSASGSAEYEVRLRSRRVRRELDGLSRTDHRRVMTILRGLRTEPRPVGCQKLRDDVYRVRVGEYRVIFRVDEARKQVDVGGIRRRSERTYRRIDDLFQ